MASLESQNQPLWFLSAKTPEELHMMMRANNARYNRRFYYLPPVFAKGKWYTWFEVPASELAKEELNNDSNS